MAVCKTLVALVVASQLAHSMIPDELIDVKLVPGPDSIGTTGTGGTAFIVVDGESLCLTLKPEGVLLKDITGLMIYEGDYKKGDGNMTVDMLDTTYAFANTTRNTWYGCIKEDAVVLKDIADDPEDYYLSVDTDVMGALMGELDG